MAVRVGERISHLARDARGIAHRKLLLGIEQLAQRRPVDAPHDEVEDFCLPADLVDRHDVRMLEARDGLRFAQEALRDHRGWRELHVEHFHRDIAIQHVVARAEHRGEAPLTQQGANGKFLSERLLQALLEGCEVHGGAKS